MAVTRRTGRSRDRMKRSAQIYAEEVGGLATNVARGCPASTM
jgi:hypothetical protein